MRAASGMIEAGGAGVFIDNSCLAHGGKNWQAMADDGSPDAVSFAFVSIIRGNTEVWTMGMHVMGLRDIVMKRSDVEVGGFDIIEVIRYVSAGEKPVGTGHIIADLDGPRFKTIGEDSPAELSRGPMHNPFGRLRLVSIATSPRRIRQSTRPRQTDRLYFRTDRDRARYIQSDAPTRG